MELRNYQQEARQSIQSEWEKGVQRTLLVLPTGCHAEDEQLLLANGESIKVQDIRLGDHLLGADGGLRNVLHIQKGHSDLYRVTPVKGKAFVVTADHKLTLIHTTTGELCDVTVEEWQLWSNNKKHLHKLIRSSAIKSFPEAEKNKLPLSPYILGVMLGDGGLKHSINVTTPHEEIAEELEREAQHWGMWLEKKPAGKASTYVFKGGSVGCKGGKLHQVLSDLGLRRCGSGDKFVPQKYKTLPIDYRLEVIAGLLDTDGHYTVGGYDFVSKSHELASDLVFMCRSVGLAAYLTETTKRCQDGFSGIYYRVSISGDCSFIPCRVKKKQSATRKQKKDVLRTGFQIEKVDAGNYVGITVDGDNRYLLDDFTITHNCGKTIVFSKVIEDRVRLGERVLVLAHRSELLDQASDKLEKSTGLKTATEKAEQTSIGSWYRVVVGSVQTMMREKRLQQFNKDFFDTIIIDEAHHCISDSYQRVLQYFEGANVLGVTATPDRGDMRNLGAYFESLAYEYTLPKAIKEGYLSPIKAMTIPLKLDLSAVGQQAGDFKSSDLGTALDPYLDSIAAEMWKVAKDRKIVVFLPLVKTSQKFTRILNEIGFKAAEVNGESQDRAEVLADFDSGKYNVLCNSMLLTEGWDCPSVDCVVVLRPTKVRSLYSQMIGRGTRLFPSKTELLLLDFLWHTERHELCHPAHLIAENEEIAKAMTKQIEEAGIPLDLETVEKQAAEDVIAQREEALAKQLEEMKRRKRKLVDPLQFEMSIQAEDLASYVPSFGWEMAPPSDAQIKTLEKLGIMPDDIHNAGKATKLLERLDKRREEGLTTPKQIRFLEQRGFEHVGTWAFDSAKRLIDRIAGNGWRVPDGINPKEYRGE
ncbi:DEAD/DEAH box helicase family protein [Paenibacillus alvei]|uniref:DEAD/DEAH box helicase family protein n=1 Tax=Paenibacillus alvei TaxID=44250 RepID=A0ABT4H5G8_PAEAL|nr:DEAD/DEAH box helicase family protein [Paenibacillus alvei]EJW19177.1 hypothetical protein PAV_1c01480 [Paenibacillus alvei DSM 29]MCY9544233.1 DEAD/DEAH box helicase family protein [Paenibacillus alvei]MCY9706341.1 DEAD/DEAH box helicase family protein [Paenibacillus alvei]MCY9732223.1 DEAD/DEAH box helicase family protein [Paenibacillus alvei]MCY9756007.1 DEAD/DEAH box helicase family protein [Paenibacillus alvei]